MEHTCLSHRAADQKLLMARFIALVAAEYSGTLVADQLFRVSLRVISSESIGNKTEVMPCRRQRWPRSSVCPRSTAGRIHCTDSRRKPFLPSPDTTLSVWHL